MIVDESPNIQVIQNTLAKFYCMELLERRLNPGFVFEKHQSIILAALSAVTTDFFVRFLCL